MATMNTTCGMFAAYFDRENAAQKKTAVYTTAFDYEKIKKFVLGIEPDIEPLTESHFDSDSWSGDVYNDEYWFSKATEQTKELYIDECSELTKTELSHDDFKDLDVIQFFEKLKLHYAQAEFYVYISDTRFEVYNKDEVEEEHGDDLEDMLEPEGLEACV